ncbi:hypothetical protein PspLS_00418 [Pyricularia sp. CBS 133598]|nr:hypothetical protein PspLS_00418 [Pyricularia sp. CBS 133598]
MWGTFEEGSGPLDPLGEISHPSTPEYFYRLSGIGSRPLQLTWAATRRHLLYWPMLPPRMIPMKSGRMRERAAEEREKEEKIDIGVHPRVIVCVRSQE